MKFFYLERAVAPQLIRAADAADIDAIVRVANHEPITIQHVLDLGAAGIIAPDIRDASQARAIGAAAHFAPAGARGSCPFGRAVGHLSQDWNRDYHLMDTNVLVIGIIEHPDGVDNVEAIAAEGGLDGLMFGPFDLSMNLGLGGELSHPDLAKIHQRVIDATRAAGIEYVTPNAAWEADLDATGSVYTNSTGTLQVFADRLRELHVKPYLHLWNLVFMRCAATFYRLGLLESPLWAGLCLSGDEAPIHHPATKAGLDAYLDNIPADVPFVWAVNAFHGDLLDLAPYIIERGRHIAIGIGDHHYAERGCPDNATLVRRIAEIADTLGRPVATPDEAKELLRAP